MSKRSYKKYSKELKATAVQEYLSGKGSLKSISKKYGILGNSQLSCWIKVLNVDSYPNVPTHLEAL